MKSLSQLLLVAAIALTSTLAHADVETLRAERVTNLSMKIDIAQSELTALQGVLQETSITTLSTGQKVFIVSSTLGLAIQQISTGIEAGKPKMVIALNAAAAGLKALAGASAIVYGIDVGSLYYMIGTKRTQVELLNQQLMLMK
ncbi:MAG: hypothetical protein H7061_01025 [Bdellovibrionaceae bacterium]|nr:hypothetical protein [Bdellovibrio sp.]